METSESPCDWHSEVASLEIDERVCTVSKRNQEGCSSTFDPHVLSAFEPVWTP